VLKRSATRCAGPMVPARQHGKWPGTARGFRAGTSLPAQREFADARPAPPDGTVPDHIRLPSLAIGGKVFYGNIGSEDRL